MPIYSHPLMVILRNFHSQTKPVPIYRSQKDGRLSKPRVYRMLLAIKSMYSTHRLRPRRHRRVCWLQIIGKRWLIAYKSTGPDWLLTTFKHVIQPNKFRKVYFRNFSSCIMHFVRKKFREVVVRKFLETWTCSNFDQWYFRVCSREILGCNKL